MFNKNNIISLLLLLWIMVVAAILLYFLDSRSVKKEENNRLGSLYNQEYKFDYNNNTLTNLSENKIIKDLNIFNSSYKKEEDCRFIQYKCYFNDLKITDLNDLRNLFKLKGLNVFFNKEDDNNIEYYLVNYNMYKKRFIFNKRDFSIKTTFINSNNVEYILSEPYSVKNFYKTLKDIELNEDYKNIKNTEDESIYISKY